MGSLWATREGVKTGDLLTLSPIYRKNPEGARCIGIWDGEEYIVHYVTSIIFLNHGDHGRVVCLVTSLPNKIEIYDFESTSFQ